MANCEALLFQRPDDAIHRGLDKQAEADIAAPGQFPLELRAADADAGAGAWWISGGVRSVHRADEAAAAASSCETGDGLSWSRSAHPRLVDGKPSKNPRYLQKRPDLANPRERYLAEIGARLDRGRSARTSPCISR